MKIRRNFLEKIKTKELTGRFLFSTEKQRLNDTESLILSLEKVAVVKGNGRAMS